MLWEGSAHAGTTPSGSPAPQPGDRTCQDCGAPNGLTAAFCRQCYQAFGANQTPPGLGRIAGVVLVTLASIGIVTWWVGRDGSVALPERVSGLVRMENAQTDLVVDTFHRQLDTMGVEGDIAMYGAGLPATVLMWIRDASAPATEAAFDEFATGFDSGIGAAGSLDVSRKTNETLDGVTYVCAPLVSDVSGTICMWQDQEVFWLLFDFWGGSFDAGKALAEGAHEDASAA